MYGYIRKLRDEKITDKNGETVRLPEQTRFYCYIIADLTSKLKELATDASYLKTPDGEGFYGINPTLNSYVEVISYRKLLDDATKRNRVLFDQLGLPTVNHYSEES